MTKRVAHTYSGNCWERAYQCRRCGRGTLCDICHVHDAPRGECQGCDPCPRCANETGTAAGNEPPR